MLMSSSQKKNLATPSMKKKKLRRLIEMVWNVEVEPCEAVPWKAETSKWKGSVHENANISEV